MSFDRNTPVHGPKKHCIAQKAKKAVGLLDRGPNPPREDLGLDPLVRSDAAYSRQSEVNESLLQRDLTAIQSTSLSSAAETESKSSSSEPTSTS